MLINHIEGEKYFATNVITSGMESRSQEIVIVRQRTKTNKFGKKEAHSRSWVTERFGSDQCGYKNYDMADQPRIHAQKSC